MAASAPQKALSLRLAALALVAFAVVFASCSRREATPATGPGGLRKVVLQTDWFPQAEHGGFYQALAKGYYREAGLDVEILPGGPNAGINLKVSKGDADFGMNRSDNIFRAVSQGLPLVMVAATFQHDPQALMMRESSPVRTFADLRERTVMANLGMTWIPYVKKKYGIDFNLLNNSFSITAFLGDPDMIQQCLITNEPFLLQQRGIPVRTLMLADSGYDCYQVMFCRRELIRESPEVVRAFVAASVRGWRDYIASDPTPAHTLILQRNPESSVDLLMFSRGELIRRKIVEGDAARGETVGQLSLERLAEQQRTLVDLQVMDRPISISQLATRDFLSSEKP